MAPGPADGTHFRQVLRFAEDHPVWAVVLGSLLLTATIVLGMIALPLQDVVPSQFMYIRF